MAKQNINVGTAANDKKGDSLRAAFQKVNANFTELYTELGLVNDVTLSLGAFEFTGSTISTTDSTAIVIDQATTVTSNLNVGGDILPQTANGGDLGSSTLPWRSLYVSNNTIFLGGTALSIDSQGNLLVGGQSIADVGTAAWNSITGKPTFATVATTGAYADLTGKPTIPTLVSQLSNDSGFLTSVGNISNIQSEGNINIEVNLTDSTKRIWQFGEDGLLTFPDGTSQSTALRTSQDESSVAIGGSGTDRAGDGISAQSGQAVAIGFRAARSAQGGGAVAIGSQAGDTSQGGSAVAIGNFAGATNQTTNAIAIGTYAGQTSQGSGAIAIGRMAGFTGQAIRSIAIGDSAGKTNQHEGTIVLNSTGSPLDTDGTGRFYVASIRNSNSPSDVVYYNTTTKEITYGANNGGSTLVNGTNTVSLGADGSLTIPGDIKSNGNINIEVNLADSTLRRWQFGEDGDTVFPNNVSINYSGNNIQFPRIIADSGKAFSVQAQGTSGSAALSWTVDPDAAGQYAAVAVSKGGGDNLAKVVLQAQSNSGDAATAKTWTFNETGNLTLPTGGVIADGGNYIKLIPPTGSANQALLIYPTAGAEGDHIHLTAGGGSTELYLGDDFHFVKLTSDGFVVIKADDGVNGAVWGFSPDGTTSIPGDIKSDSNINIEINITDSTLRRWQFGEDGELTVPGPIRGLGNSKLDFTTYGANSAYLTTTDNDSTALFMGAVSVDLYAHTNINIRTNTDGTSKQWTFGDDGSLTVPGSITLTNGAVIKDTDGDAVAFGQNAGLNQAFRAVAIGASAGSEDQGTRAVAIGGQAGELRQSNYGVAIGASAAYFEQGVSAVAIGDNAGQSSQGDYAIAVGHYAGHGNQSANSIILNASGAILNGAAAGFYVAPIRNISATSGVLQYNASTKEVSYSNSVTAETFNTDQITIVGNRITTTVTNANLELECNGTGGVVVNRITLTNGAVIKDTDGGSVAFGLVAGLTSQGQNAVAIGVGAGYQSQGNEAVAIGINAGVYSQGAIAVAIGESAGYNLQGRFSVAIGYYAGSDEQGRYSIAIGYAAGTNNQAANSIVLNATGATLNQTTANTFTVAPIRNISATSGVLQYNASTKEVSYSNRVTAESFDTDQITIVGNRISTTVTNANLELECNGTGGVVINTVADATTASTVKSVGYLGLPQSATATSATLAIGDAGKHIYVTTASQTITIPANASVAYPIGTTLTFIAGPSATTVLIAITSDTLRLAGGTSTGTRTLAANGMATAVKVAATTWYINGTGLT